MPKVSKMFPSRYLKPSDCEDKFGSPVDLVLTIDRVAEERVGYGSESELKWVAYFQETEKLLVLNKTNLLTISKLHGDDSDDWEGQKIALYATEVQFQSDMVAAIRVRSKPPGVKKSGKQQPTVAPVDQDDHESDEAPF